MCFGEDVPKIFVDTMGRAPTVVFNHHEFLNELYVTKNKYYDKDPSITLKFGVMFGKSLTVLRSNEEWAEKRKRV
jgi:hypothetical protein